MESLQALGRWAYPDPATRGFLDNPRDIGLALLPLAFHLVSIHLLLRHHHRPLANALRAGVITPLTILASIRAGMGAVMPIVPFGPNPAGKSAPSWLHYTQGGLETEGGAQHVNVAIGVYGAYSIMKAFEWGFAARPPRLRPEILDIARAERKARTSNGQANGASKEEPIGPDSLPFFFPGTRIPLALELLINMRGVGWEWGLPFAAGHPPVPRPAARTPAAHALQARRAQLVRSYAWLAFRLFLVIDALDSLLKSPALFGPRANVGGPLVLGGAAAESLRYEEYPWWKGALLTLMAGIVVPTSMQATYALVAALSLLPAYLLPHSDLVWRHTFADPALWAVPLLGRPHAPTDLRTLWGAEWHALFRAPFLAVAYHPVNNALKALGLGTDTAPRTRRLERPSSATAAATQGRDGNSKDDAAAGARATATRTGGKGGGGGGAWRGPPGKLLRRALSVLSVFFVSGLMHEAGQLAMARTPADRDPRRLWGQGEPVLVYAPPEPGTGVVRLAYVDRGGRCMVFFFMQGVACVLEDVLEMLYKSARGGKAQSGATSALLGWLKWLWVAGWIFGLGQYVGKSWYRMGIAQGIISMRATGALAHLVLGAFRPS